MSSGSIGRVVVPPGFSELLQGEKERQAGADAAPEGETAPDVDAALETGR